MRIIEKIEEAEFPLKWANLNFFPDSIAERKEIYLNNGEDIVGELAILFFSLFGEYKNELLIYSESFWDFCLSTWSMSDEVYSYEMEGKPVETRNYLEMLKESNIEIGYSGNCRCLSWDKFLKITLSCIVSHQAPYSHIFYDKRNGYFFYFHHSGSVGFYYKEKSLVVSKILQSAEEEYIIK